MTDPLTTLASIEQKADKADTLKACKCGGFVSLDERIRLGTITVDGYKASCQCGCSGPWMQTKAEAIAADGRFEIMEMVASWRNSDYIRIH